MIYAARIHRCALDKESLGNDYIKKKKKKEEKSLESIRLCNFIKYCIHARISSDLFLSLMLRANLILMNLIR